MIALTTTFLISSPETKEEYCVYVWPNYGGIDIVTVDEKLESMDLDSMIRAVAMLKEYENPKAYVHLPESDISISGADMQMITCHVWGQLDYEEGDDDEELGE
jgi:hypothetical protein